jgi:hypothetical protein
MTGAAELAEAFRRAPAWHQAISDAQALAVAEMREAMTVKEIAAALGLSDKRVYQLLGEAAAVEADPQRLRRAGAIAELASAGEERISPMIQSGTTVWVVSGWDRDGYAVYGVYATKGDGEEAEELIDEPTSTEPFVIGAPPVDPTAEAVSP